MSGVEDTARHLAALSPRHRELVTFMAEDETKHRSDVQHADDLARVFTEDLEEAMTHGAWLRAVARRLVIDDRDIVAAVASALLEQTYLAGDDVIAICRAIDTGPERRRRSLERIDQPARWAHFLRHPEDDPPTTGG